MSDPSTPWWERTNPDITVRLARSDELDTVGDVLERAYDTAYGIDDNYRAELHRLGEYWEGLGDIWVAVRQGHIAGAIVTPAVGQPQNFVIDPPEPELGFRQLGVDPAQQGHGVGAALVGHVVKLALERNIRTVDLYTQPRMERAQRLYCSLGFVRAPHRDSCVPGTDHELIAYILPLRREITMTITTLPEASPVDFETYGEAGGWAKALKSADDGTFIRAPYPFQGRITADGEFAPAPNRYVIYVSYACPWAQRQLIVRELKGLQDVIGVAIVDPVRDARGWAFRSGDSLTLDPYNGFTLLREAYDATEPGYPGHISVPALWDTVTKRLVSNNFPDISIDLGSQFNQWATNPDLDLYPAALRAEIDELNEVIYNHVNNGVYKSGLARSQSAYDKAVHELFETLDALELRLADRKYLFGDNLTEADIRLYPTLARFDAVYVTHFKTNIRRLIDYPNLWDYARYLYQQPDFGETTNFDHIKRHYFITHAHINPTRIVPAGFKVDWTAPTQR